MKFTIVVVMLAMAFAVEASWSVHHHPQLSVWGNGLWGHHGDWHGDAHHGDWHGDAYHGDWHGDAHHGGWDDGHWGHGHSHTHGISLDQGHGWGHHGHGPVHAHHDHHHDHHGHHHDGHYVAKTLGAVHTAPLPGHIASVKSVNVASAPGTH